MKLELTEKEIRLIQWSMDSIAEIIQEDMDDYGEQGFELKLKRIQKLVFKIDRKTILKFKKKRIKIKR